MFNSTDFTFDGISSIDMNVKLVREESGMFERPVSASRSITKQKNKNKNIPSTLGFEYEDLKFTICVYYDGEWTQVKKQEILSWLFKETYKPFVSDDNLDIVYYCMATGSPQWKLDSLNRGYLKVEMECDSAFAYTTIYEPTFDLTINPSVTNISVASKSNILTYYYPEIEFTKVGAGNISFKNLSDGGRTLTFTGLTDGETIYVNNDTAKIISSTGNNRLGNCNRQWLRLLYGVNTIEVTGTATIKFRCQYPMGV